MQLPHMVLFSCSGNCLGLGDALSIIIGKGGNRVINTMLMMVKNFFCCYNDDRELKYINMQSLSVKPGVKYREIGNIIQKHAQAHGFSVVKSYCGHGIHE